MNSWHSLSPNGKWMAFASKVNGPFTQIWLTHMDSQGRASVPVCLEHFTAANRAANIPEFVNTTPSQFSSIYQNFADYYTHYRAGILHETRHQYREAIGEFHRALKEKPDHVESLYLLASCLARIDQEREAIPFARKAAQQMPNSAMIHGLLGGLLCNTGQHSEAVVHLQIAHKANPGDIGVAGNLAWLWATAPNPLLRNGPHAVRLAEWVNKTTAYKSPPLLDTLAAAYAEAGLFDKAISTTQQAIELVRHNPTASTTELESRLRLYKAGRPYHEHGE